MRIKSLPLDPRRVKAGPDDGLNDGEFIVYPSTFIRTPDSWGDVVKAGAFANGIQKRKEQGIVLPGLFGHRMDNPEMFVASALEESEDEIGWRVKGAFDLDEPIAQKVYRLVKGRRLRELSFAYDVIDEGSVTLDGGVKANELRDLDVFEFSFVPVGANRDTSVVAVKAAADHLIVDLKAGRTLSAKNEEQLRSAHEAIGRVLDTLSDPSSEDDSKAVVHEPLKAEELTRAKAEEATRALSASLLTRLQIAAGDLDLIDA